MSSNKRKAVSIKLERSTMFICLSLVHEIPSRCARAAEQESLRDEKHQR